MAHLKGPSPSIDVVGYLSPLTMAIAGRSNRSRRVILMIHYSTVVMFEAVRSLAIPPPPGHTRVGGRCGSPKTAGAPFSIQSEKQLLRQRCDARGFKPLPIEIIARRKVAPAFEPQKASGRGAPASQCKAMDASGPAELSRRPRLQHQGCGDYSLSNVV